MVLGENIAQEAKNQNRNWSTRCVVNQSRWGVERQSTGCLDVSSLLPTDLLSERLDPGESCGGWGRWVRLTQSLDRSIEILKIYSVEFLERGKRLLWQNLKRKNRGNISVSLDVGLSRRRQRTLSICVTHM